MQKNKKDLSFFGFSQVFNHQFIQKTKKTLSFLVFSRSWPKKPKKLEDNQKKPNMSLRPNILWKVLVFWFFGFLEVFGFPHGFSPKEKSNSWLVLLNLEKTKKPKNQNFSENVWSEAHVWFFLVFLEFFLFFFGHDIEKTKKTQGFFVFLEELLLEVSQKTKKLRSFLVFWTDF